MNTLCLDARDCSQPEPSQTSCYVNTDSAEYYEVVMSPLRSCQARSLNHVRMLINMYIYQQVDEVQATAVPLQYNKQCMNTHKQGHTRPQERIDTYMQAACQVAFRIQMTAGRADSLIFDGYVALHFNNLALLRRRRVIKPVTTSSASPRNIILIPYKDGAQSIMMVDGHTKQPVLCYQ
jgi:hypothetical protein